MRNDKTNPGSNSVNMKVREWHFRPVTIKLKTVRVRLQRPERGSGTRPTQECVRHAGNWKQKQESNPQKDKKK